MAKNHPNSTSLRLGKTHMFMLARCMRDMNTSQVGVVRHLLEKKYAAIARKEEKREANKLAKSTVSVETFGFTPAK